MLILAAMVMLLTSCASRSTVTVKNECSWSELIYIGDDDQLTDQTARQILFHNKMFLKMCRQGQVD
ncbi:hypothetical protein CARROT_61 [Serratia phage vB_SmaS_Carrot]|uniref:O-spanin n=1 Tax=Serratia phage vB_SmaS_Bigdog TaxID=2777364 RepID=A0A7T3NA59_9CAUD|nr:hypothetical protein QJS28_gp64 [Serratia phage vB_SmaS_Bigdog]QPX75168.1 hypothetical protein BIGDOG_64 [Serratia phage vB_SmaS_Bigdog]QPX75398.1 hypothetical protein [Serratia phage vB_SmaS_Opt-148]UGO51867.1 hypothetical protein CARROT_61 [Serratia phage vB_SmaS_Carrot]